MTTPARFVVDTDPGVDDALAIAYLAAAPDAEIVAIGSVHGNVPAPLAAANALRVLDRLNLPHVPVAVGANRPLNGKRLRSGQHVHGSDGLSGCAGPPSPRTPIAETAEQQLVRLARCDPGRLSVLALGPLTNLALALRGEPRLPELVREVVWMGGAIAVPGNITPHADANTWHDPEAAEEVLAAGFALTMVPLDTTNHAWAGEAWWDAVARHDHALAQYLTAVSGHYIRRYSARRGRLHQERGCVLHDPLTVAIALDRAIADYEEHQVAVELTGTHTRGATVVDRRARPEHLSIHFGRHKARIAVRADIDTMLSRLHKALLL